MAKSDQDQEDETREPAGGEAMMTVVVALVGMAVVFGALLAVAELRDLLP